MTAPQGRDLTIVNKRGLHARASAKFVRLVEKFDADIHVRKDGFAVTGDSIMGLLLLAAARGETIHVSATGVDAEAALSAIEELICCGFEEDN